MARIGQMDRKISIERAEITRDAYNEGIETWEMLKENVWAAVRRQSGKEALQSDQVVASNVVVFTIHYMELYTTDRIHYEGKVYDIQSLNEIGRRKQLEIIAHGRDNSTSGS